MGTVALGSYELSRRCFKEVTNVMEFRHDLLTHERRVVVTRNLRSNLFRFGIPSVWNFQSDQETALVPRPSRVLRRRVLDVPTWDSFS